MISFRESHSCEIFRRKSQTSSAKSTELIRVFSHMQIWINMWPTYHMVLMKNWCFRNKCAFIIISCSSNIDIFVTYLKYNTSCPVGLTIFMIRLMDNSSIVSHWNILILSILLKKSGTYNFIYMISFIPLPFLSDKVRKDFHNQVLRIALKPPIKYKRLNIIIFILHTSKKNLRVKISITLIYIHLQYLHTYIYVYFICPLFRKINTFAE